MKNIITFYTKYNLWANTKLCGFISKIEDAKRNREVKSSFPSIIKTLYHIWGAESLWHKRIHGESLSYLPGKDFNGSFQEFSKPFLAQSEKFVSLVKDWSNEQLEKNCKYKDTKGHEYINSYAEMLMHCMNHSTYHRGQIITILRNLDCNDLPSTDLIVYLRENSATN